MCVSLEDVHEGLPVEALEEIKQEFEEMEDFLACEGIRLAIKIIKRLDK